MINLKHIMSSLILASVLIFPGCNNTESIDVIDDGLVINSISYSLGGDLDKTVVSYNFNLWNRTENSINIISATPILTEELSGRLGNQSIVNEINRTINSNTSEVITGSFYLDTNGLDKKEIEKLNIELKQFRVLSEQTLGFDK
ncbi:hypothetical protein DNH61_00110 [Paenibacillus sambharensis]|uniref:Uncharacterized protein n=1 Tax=Paenibacillus sambharensis TaxID=1803190 RepID=A0A2W1LBW1_9BACL|nr:hypothetical protein [Paenibacillus sambharensis]PZD97708.1 hypothetical protein DNH61_00110 [Paenibacillus sambharensis]